ncbi:MAG: S1-like domain-containing RNA-binding protein [Verrucomicrobiota bacterium]|nr:S1-like domain-containing RNA-binding protein [Verrucomicrobiota bacterium]
MAIIGKWNKLRVLRDTSPGMYLDDGHGGDILLPGKYIPRDLREGDDIDVFVYLDSEDRLVATTEKPFATVGEFAALRVAGINRNIGAFLEWGLPKDLLLPFREQLGPLREGQTVVVYIYQDIQSSRLVGTMRLKKHLSQTPPPYTQGQAVNLLVTNPTPLGYSAIIENQYTGLLFNDHLSGPLKVGQKLKGFIQSVRPDGKVDLRLDESGYQKVMPLRDLILLALKRNRGRLELDDKTPPEDIRERFGVSKKTFKQALGALYKERIIIFENQGIRLLDQDSKK